jgi:integrase
MDNINTPTGTIQKILGHENHRTTGIYLHSFNKTEKQAIRDDELSDLNYWYTRQDSNLLPLMRN